MKRHTVHSIFGLLSALFVAIAVTTSSARGADLSQPVLLVATSALDDSPFAQSVILAAPWRDGKHIGFIVNKPTTLQLAALLPEDVGARSVKDPVYLGGSVMLPGVFAVTRTAPAEAGTVVALMPGVVAVIDGVGVDRVIATMPNDARFFVGLMLWDDDDLEAQIDGNAWQLRPADADAVFRVNAKGLWTSLRDPST